MSDLQGENEQDSHRQDSMDSCGSLTTRKLLTDMECGAYNSDSLGSPSAGTSGPSGEQVRQRINVVIFQPALFVFSLTNVFPFFLHNNCAFLSFITLNNKTSKY